MAEKLVVQKHVHTTGMNGRAIWEIAHSRISVLLFTVQAGCRDR